MLLRISVTLLASFLVTIYIYIYIYNCVYLCLAVCVRGSLCVRAQVFAITYSYDKINMVSVNIGGLNRGFGPYFKKEINIWSIFTMKKKSLNPTRTRVFPLTPKFMCFLWHPNASGGDPLILKNWWGCITASLSFFVFTPCYTLILSRNTFYDPI